MTTTRWMQYRDLPWASADSGTCRVCGCEKRDGERWHTFCKNDGEACLHWYKIRADPGYARRAVERRDKGVCALCGLDTRALAQRISALERSLGDGKSLDSIRSLMQTHGYKPGRNWAFAELITWEADHILPVVEGGGMCGLEGLRTLCLPCHHKESAALAGRLARKRHDERHPGHFLD